MDSPSSHTESLTSKAESFSQSDTESPSVKDRLEPFPHSFQLQNQDRLGKEELERMKTGLESALSVGYKTELETARARNLLAYTLYRLDKSTEALEQLELVLKLDSETKNLVTLANKAIILEDMWHFSEAQVQVHSLIQLRKEDEDFQYLVVRAKAELAFSYTRMGPSFSQCAVAAFEEVLPQARKPEKWLWMYGLALTTNRTIQAEPVQNSTRPSSQGAAEHRDLVELLMGIAENCSCQNLKAKAYAEMAVLLFRVSNVELVKELYAKVHMNPEQACDTALTFERNDHSVLCRCGRILRSCGQPERSCELLERAVTLRKSPTAHHELGLTYQILAEQLKPKHSSTESNSLCQVQNSSYGNAKSCHNLNTNFRLTSPKRQTSPTRPAYNGSGFHYHNAGSFASARDSQVGSSPITDVWSMKSPVSFSRDNLEQAALSSLETAVELGKELNPQALMDLALLQKRRGEPRKAKESLQKTLRHESSLPDLQYINIYEEMGLITRELSESETNASKKSQLSRDSNAMLLKALRRAHTISSMPQGGKEYLGGLNSFSILLQDVEKSSLCTHKKLQFKAHLFYLNNDHQQSLEQLQEIEQIDPQKGKDPSHLKLCIESFEAVGNFEKSLVCVERLKAASNNNAISTLFNDKQLVQKIYLKAASQALLREPQMASNYFRSAFREALLASPAELHSSGCSSRCDTVGNKAWDVVIVHDESARELAETLIELLDHVCGLKVPILDRDADADDLDMEADLRVINDSALLVVVAGSKISRLNRLYTRINAIRLPNKTVTLLIDTEKPPEPLKEYPFLVCPSELLQSCKTDEGKMTESKADAICEFFSFLIGVNMKLPKG